MSSPLVFTSLVFKRRQVSVYNERTAALRAAVLSVGRGYLAVPGQRGRSVESRSGVEDDVAERLVAERRPLVAGRDLLAGRPDLIAGGVPVDESVLFAALVELAGDLVRVGGAERLLAQMALPGPQASLEEGVDGAVDLALHGFGGGFARLRRGGEVEDLRLVAGLDRESARRHPDLVPRVAAVVVDGDPHAVAAVRVADVQREAAHHAHRPPHAVDPPVVELLAREGEVVAAVVDDVEQDAGLHHEVHDEGPAVLELVLAHPRGEGAGLLHPVLLAARLR